MSLLKTFAAALLGAASLYAASVDVTGAYVREVPPNMPNSAAFMTLSNMTDAPLSLVEARSDAAGAVELHTHSMIDGMMKMHRIEKIDIPAEGTAVLAPGGHHVMLIGLKHRLAEGDTVSVTLRFSNGEEVTLDAPVKKIENTMKPAMRCAAGKCGSGKCGSR